MYTEACFSVFVVAKKKEKKTKKKVTVGYRLCIMVFNEMGKQPDGSR